MWTMLAILVSAIIVSSIFFKALDDISIMLSRVLGVTCVVFSLLLFVAGFIGGSFHLSESNEIVLVGLLVTGFLGCLFFFIKPRQGGAQ